MAKQQQSKRKRRLRGRPQVTFYGSQIFCRLAPKDKALVLRASRAYDRRTGKLRTANGKIRSLNDYVREVLILAAEAELKLEKLGG